MSLSLVRLSLGLVLSLSLVAGLSVEPYGEDLRENYMDDYAASATGSSSSPVAMVAKRDYVSRSCDRCLHDPDDFGACVRCYSHPNSITPYFGLKKRAFDDQSAFLPDLGYYSPEGKRAFQDLSSFLPQEYYSPERLNYNKRGYSDIGLGFLPEAEYYYSPERVTGDYSAASKRSGGGDGSSRGAQGFLPEEFYSPERLSRSSWDTVSKRSSFMACKCCLSVGRPGCCSRCGFRPMSMSRSHGYKKRGFMTTFFPLDSRRGCSCCDYNFFDFPCCIRCRSRK